MKKQCALLIAVLALLSGRGAQTALGAPITPQDFGVNTIVETFDNATSGISPVVIGGNTYTSSVILTVAPFIACQPGQCIAPVFDIDYIEIALAQPAINVGGFVFGGFNTDWTIEAEFFGLNGELLATVSASDSSSVQAEFVFLGFGVETGAISRVRFSDRVVDRSLLLLDNFMFEPVFAVPEPPGFALLPTMLGMLWLVARLRSLRVGGSDAGACEPPTPGSCGRSVPDKALRWGRSES